MNRKLVNLLILSGVVALLTLAPDFVSARSENVVSSKTQEVPQTAKSVELRKGLLTQYADANVTPTLATKALKAYVKLLAKGNYNDTQRVIFLREALAQVKSDADRNLLLAAVAKCSTMQALCLAGQYVEQPATQKQAGKAVVEILKRDAEHRFWGVQTQSLVEKMIATPQSGYDKAVLQKYLAEKPQNAGFATLFNGVDLTGWKGLVLDPIKRSKMTPEQLQTAQIKADSIMRMNWIPQDGELHFSGKGANICTVKPYGNFEMYVDWRIGKNGDSGIYLRGTPQVQIWDIARVKDGADVGSGGLYNNTKHLRKPLVVADNPVGEWNTFYIKMIGDRVTVYLNGVLVVDNIVMENFWDRKQPIFPTGQIELQAHGELIAFRDIFVNELPDQQ